MEALKSAIVADLQQIQYRSPLILSLTNFVAMDLTANALLSIGASPIMAHAPEELEELAHASNAVVLNMGTLDGQWRPSFLSAAKCAKANGRPLIFDPVGAGASDFRRQFAKEILDTKAATGVRGNASEILSLYFDKSESKGVDSTHAPSSVAQMLIERREPPPEVVAISGAEDFVLSLSQWTRISNGDPIMGRVTAMGCTATAICAAFAAVNPNPFEAMVHAMVVMGVCGQIARTRSQGPGSFRVAFVDALSQAGKGDWPQLRVERHAL